MFLWETFPFKKLLQMRVTVGTQPPPAVVHSTISQQPNGPSKSDKATPPPSPILECKCHCDKGDGEIVLCLGTVRVSENWQWLLWL